jgi:hypothetical protein
MKHTPITVCSFNNPFSKMESSLLAINKMSSLTDMLLSTKILFLEPKMASSGDLLAAI